MPADLPVRMAALAAVAGAALFGAGGASGRLVIATLLFGAVNVLLQVGGTTVVRIISVCATVAALLWGGDAVAFLLLVACLAWPPAFMFAWARARRMATDEPAGRRTGMRARVTVVAIVAAVAIGSFAYRVVVHQQLDQTAALFIGVPALLAIVVNLTVSPQSSVGVACKAVTIALLVSALFLWEGVLCILMSAPLFYAVAIAAGSVADVAKESRDSGPRTLSCVALLALLPMSLEGVTDATSLNRDERVTAAQVVFASADAVEEALTAPPRFDRALPLYLRAGFPWPEATRIVLTEDGAHWIVRMRGGEMRIDGMEPRAGDLVLQLAERRPGRVRWRVLSDDSHLTHFLTWQESIVEWEPLTPHSTRLQWTLRYRRGLDPAWYFGPWERYAARLAAGYLIDSVATP